MNPGDGIDLAGVTYTVATVNGDGTPLSLFHPDGVYAVLDWQEDGPKVLTLSEPTVEALARLAREHEAPATTAITTEQAEAVWAKRTSRRLHESQVSPWRRTYR